MLKSNKILLSLSVAALLGVGGSIVENNVEQTPQVVQAASSKKLTKNAYVYKANGKRTGKKLKKGKKVKVLGTKKIKGKKYYRIGKNQYVRIANFKVATLRNTSVSNGSSSTNDVTSSSNVSSNGSSNVKSSGNYTVTTDKNGNKVITGKKTSNGGNTSSSTNSQSNSSSSKDNNSSTNNGNSSNENSGATVNSRWRSMDNSATLSAKEEAKAKKNGENKAVYFSDSELQQIQDHLWQNIQNYRKSKGYSAFKTNSELTRLAQQSQIPGTAEFNRFNDKMSQNTDEIKSYLPNLASKGFDQAIGFVDSTAYGLNSKGFVIGGNFTHSGWTPTQVADKLFDVYKNADGFQSKMIYGWKEHNAFGALSVHYYVSHLGYSRNAVGISFFTVDGTSPEWINFWKNN